MSSKASPDTTISRIERALSSRAPGRLEAESRAAVCMVLRAEGPESTSVLLIERTRRPDDPWAGQMAFPGGRLDPGDEDALSAAFREAREEVGLDLSRAARLLGRCDDLRAIARGRPMPLVISPFVFELMAGDVSFDLQHEEVAGVLWAPFEEMVSGRVDGTYAVSRPDVGTVNLPCYHVGGKVVWGLTYLMLRNLFRVIEPGV
jgi:8-oxo-dGTP pyrophosphatase MutT (NUDIX family)